MPLLPPSSLLQSVLVAMTPWTGAQRAFAVKAFYKSSDSFVIVVFHLPMPSRPGFKTLRLWFYTKEKR
jgi:hypothetical protein